MDILRDKWLGHLKPYIIFYVGLHVGSRRVRLCLTFEAKISVFKRG